MIAVGSAWRRKGRPYATRLIVSMLRDGFVYAHYDGTPWESYGWKLDVWLALLEPEDPALLAALARCDAEDAALAGICEEAAV